MHATEQPNARRVVTIFLCWCLIPLAVLALVNVLVDPLGLLPLRGITGVNAMKPMQRGFERQFKPFAVLRVNPEAVLLGSSRTNQAMNPEHRAFAGLRTYNLAVNGTSVTEIRKLFEHVLSLGTVRVAVVELDLDLFDEGAATPQSTAYLATVDHTRWLARVGFVLSSALSWDSLLLTRQTLARQHEVSDYNALGMSDDRGYRQFAALNGGIGSLFASNPLASARRKAALAEKWRTAAVHRYNFPDLDEVATIIRLANERGIRLVFFIPPNHAQEQYLVRSIFDADLLDDWKRALVDTVESTPSSLEVVLWDFSGYNSVTEESVPDPANHDAAMRYYLDPRHVRPRVGNWMLERMFDLPDPAAPIPDDFGVRLSSANEERVYAGIRAAEENYSRRHPREMALADGIVADEVTLP